MESGEGLTTVWTRRRVQVVVLAALLVALGIGWHESRELSPADIPLADLAKQIGLWQMVSEEIGVSGDDAYKLLERTYQDDEGQELHVTIQATYTRLGSLRDWSLASMASGWSVTREWTWTSRDSETSSPIEARLQELVRGTERRVVLTWYTSAQAQARTLQSAQLKGWRDRLVGGKKPWASMYLLTEASSAAAGEEAVKQLAQRLAPELRQLMCTTHP